MDKFEAYFIIITVVTFIAVVWTNLFLPINVDASWIPSLVNGMTSSMSIIVGFMGGFIGIMLHETSKNDKKAKTFYFRGLLLLLIPLSFLWTTYALLTIGWSETAIRYGLSFLSITFYLFFAIVLYSVKILKIE